MRDALAADLAGVPGWQVACAVGPDAAAQAPRYGRAEALARGESASEFLRRIAPAYDAVWAVAPECEGTLGLLCSTVGAARWVGCEADAIRTASSKSATREALAAAGIEVPAWRPQADSGDAPWVVKPDDGAGAVETRRHAGREAAERDLRNRRTRGEAATMERWVEGRPMSLSLLATAHGAELLAINRQRVAVADDGAVSYFGVQFERTPSRPDDRALAALAARIHAAIPGLRGYVGVDLVLTAGGRPVVIEVNPRLTCAYVGLSKRLGRNLAGEVLACLSLAPQPEAPLDVA